MVDPLRAATALRRRGGPLEKHAPRQPPRPCKSGTYLPRARLHAVDVPSACTSACGRYVPDLQPRLCQTGQSSLDAPASPCDDQRCYGVAGCYVALRVQSEPPVLVAVGRRGGSRSRLFGSARGRYVPNLHARRRYVPDLHVDQMKNMHTEFVIVFRCRFSTCAAPLDISPAGSCGNVEAVATMGKRDPETMTNSTLAKPPSREMRTLPIILHNTNSIMQILASTQIWTNRLRPTASLLANL